jgi:predicted membrane protein
MKMGCSFFIGLFFIFIGLEIMLKVFFNLSIPLMRLLFALLFVYIGVSIFVGRPILSHHRHGVCLDRGTNMFGSFSESLEGKELADRQVSVVFGEKTLNLKGAKLAGEKAVLRLDCVFGSMKVMLDKDMPVKITGSSAFGNVVLPEANSVVFGSNKYESPNAAAGKPYLEIRASAVFGEITIVSSSF